MTCDDIRYDLVAYHRGALRGAERSALEGHLESCAACRSDLEELAATMAAVEQCLLPFTPTPGMKEGALALVEMERLGPVLRAADLHAPPEGLKARSLARATAAPDTDAVVRAFPTRVAAAALAAAAVAAVFFALSYRAQLGGVAEERDRAEEVAARAEEQGGPAGHPVQTLALAGPGAAATVDLYHFRHDNFRVVLKLEEMPVTPPGHHYEVWLTGPAGEVSVGSFRIKSADRFTNAWVVGVDPVDFPKLALTVEANDGDPSMAGQVLAEAAIDEDHVYHGRYDE